MIYLMTILTAQSLKGGKKVSFPFTFLIPRTQFDKINIHIKGMGMHNQFTAFDNTMLGNDAGQILLDLETNLLMREDKKEHKAYR